MDVGIDVNTPININIKEQVCVCGGTWLVVRVRRGGCT